MTRKGGRNQGPSQITERPAAPAPINRSTNNPPDILLELTHEQATFMLENCLANNRLCVALILSYAEEDIDIELKRAKAEKITVMQNKFRDIMTLLRKAGAREKEE
jgi:hypothetical protein